MEIRNSFDIPLPPDRAWPVLMDIPRIVHCVPGAELTEKVDERTYKGKVSVKLGPIGLLLNGIATFTAVDDAAHVATVSARGTDAKGRGGANSTLRFSLAPTAEGSRVDVVTDVTLSGMVAQYGRGTGLIQGVATQLVNQFAASLREMLAGEEASAPPPPAGKTEARETGPAPAKPISGLSLFLRAVWGTITGFFRRR